MLIIKLITFFIASLYSIHILINYFFIYLRVKLMSSGELENISGNKITVKSKTGSHYIKLPIHIVQSILISLLWTTFFLLHLL